MHDMKQLSSGNANRPELSLQAASVVRDSTRIDGNRPNRGGFESDNIKQLIALLH